MTIYVGQSPLVLEPLRRKHIVASVVAVVLSAGFHLVLIYLFPPLHVGKPPEFGPADSIVPTRLDKVFTKPLPLVERPDKFRPENPEQFKSVTEDVREFAGALENVLDQTMALDQQVELIGETAPIEEAAPPEPSNEWSARQEILQIEEKIYADEVSLLPRAYASVVPRIASAPDIALPIESLDALVAPPDGFAEPGGSGSGYLQAMALRTPPPRESGLTDVEEKTLGESSMLIDEPMDEVSLFEPIEQLLDLDVSTFQSPGEGFVYFRLEIRRHGPESLPVLPKNVLLIQDSSQSMTQSKLNLCKRGLERWLYRLRPEDRFNIISFREDVVWCFGDWQPVNPQSRLDALAFIDGLRARGKTDVFKSLQPLVQLESEVGRPVLAVLVTDGRPTRGLVDTSDIIVRFSQANEGQVSVFALGGGKRVNQLLLDMLSYSNRGDARIIEDQHNIPAGMDQWAVRLARPVMTDLRYRFSGLDESEIYPRTLTHLFLDRPLVLYGRLSLDTRQAAFQVVGHSGQAKKDLVFGLDMSRTVPGDGAIRTQWAWQKIYHLIGEHILTGNDAIMAEIGDLAARHGLKVPYDPDIPPRN